ncbi:hypothetical protein D3C72_2083460 [compost metagenome]
MLAGEPAHLAGEFRVTGQVLVPELLVALIADAIEAASRAAVQCRAEGGLAGGSAQQQAFGGGGGALQVEQRRSYHMLAEIAGGNSHGALANDAGGAGAFGSFSSF